MFENRNVMNCHDDLAEVSAQALIKAAKADDRLLSAGKTPEGAEPAGEEDRQAGFGAAQETAYK